MIGKVLYPDGEAILDEEGIWQCPDPDDLLLLRVFANPHDTDFTDSILPFGQEAVQKGADLLHGRAVFP